MASCEEVPPRRSLHNTLQLILGAPTVYPGRLSASPMSPDTSRCVHLHLPCTIVYFPCAPTVFHGKAGWRAQIERYHVIGGMFAQAHEDRHVAVLTEIVRRAHIIERIHLEHKVVQPLGRLWQCGKGQRMVPRVAVKKDNVELHLMSAAKRSHSSTSLTLKPRYPNCVTAAIGTSFGFRQTVASATPWTTG